MDDSPDDLYWHLYDGSDLVGIHAIKDSACLRKRIVQGHEIYNNGDT